MIKIQYASISETGKRQKNEDAFRIVGMADGNRWLAVVCDGMGGHDKGEVASETVADAIVDYCATCDGAFFKTSSLTCGSVFR